MIGTSDALRRGIVAIRRASFQSDERGGVAVASAFALLVLLSIAALSIETSIIYVSRLQAQRVSDMAALAAANTPNAIINGALSASAKDTAMQVAVLNGFNSTLVRTTIVQDGAGKNAIRSNVATDVPLVLGGLLNGDGLLQVSASASAGVGETNPICIITLNSRSSDSFEVDNGAQLNAPNCQVKVNSSSSEAATFGSSSIVNVASIEIVGGYDANGGASITPPPVKATSLAADPYASIPSPIGPPCGGTNDIEGKTITITANRSFCNGLTIDDSIVTFSPGTYVIDGYFILRSGAHIKGTDVTIFMRGQGGQLFFHSGTSFDLAAPTTGPYAGIVLWSDRLNTRDSDIYSKMGATASGTFYFPSSQLEIESRVQWSTDCIRIVAGRLQLDSYSKYIARDPNNNCKNNIREGGSRANLFR